MNVSEFKKIFVKEVRQYLILEDQQYQERLKRDLNWTIPTEMDIKIIKKFLRKQKLKNLTMINSSVK